MPKSKKRTKHGVAVRPAGPRGLAQSAALWPLHECLITGNWRDTMQLMQIVVARRNPANGVVVAAIYLIDLGCLGIKDATLLRFTSTAEYRYTLEGSVMLIQLFEPAPLDLAAKILHEAAAYGRSLGFIPRGDYTDSLPLLQGARPENVAEQIPLGVDGKPFYVSGPDDHPGKILRQLEKAVGPGNFDYTIMLAPGVAPPLGIDPTKLSLLPISDEYETERLGWLPPEMIAALDDVGDEEPEQAIALFRPSWPIALAREFLAQAPPQVAEALQDVPPEELPERLRAEMPLVVRAEFDGLLHAIPASLEEYLELLDTVDVSEPDTAQLPPELLAKLASADPREAAEADSSMLDLMLDDLADVVPKRTLNALRGQPVDEAIPALLEALPADLRAVLEPQFQLILELRGQMR